MNTDRRLRDDPRPGFAVLLVWAGATLFISALAWSLIAERRFPDPDDVLRLIQVRDLIGGQGWFDLHQYRINPPEGVMMHWSRLVDIPLALLILALEPFLGMEQAEWVAALILPPLILLAVMQIVARLAWRLADRQTAIFSAIVLALWSGFLVQMQPLRIDHHAWQILSVAVALWAISWRQPIRGGAVAGTAMGLGTMISLELLPLVAGFGIVLAIRWALDHRDRVWLTAYMQALAMTLAVVFVLTKSGSALSTYCDAVTLPHVGFFVIAALGTSVIASRQRLPLITLGALFILTGAIGAGFIALSAPQCFTAPFGVLDPLVHKFWYSNVKEGMPIWRLAPTDYIPAGLHMLIACIGSIAIMLRQRDWLRQWWAEYTVLLVIACLAAAATFRSLYFVAVIGAIPTAWLASRALQLLREGETLAHKIVAPILLYVVIMPGSVAGAALGLLGGESERVGQSSDGKALVLVRDSSCDLARSTMGFNSLEPATFFAPLDVGPFVLLNTPHSVVATGHHRANLAIRDTIAGFIGTPAEARAIIDRHGAGYVAICTEIAEPHVLAKAGGEGSFAARLLADNPPEWLEEVDLGTPEAFKVWRVRRDQAGRKSIAAPLMQ